MIVTFIGSGPSHGVPVIGCDCSVCKSNDSKNIRWRAGLVIQKDKASVLIDTPPEFRLQALKYKIPQLDGVFFTHHHADHIHGFDDLRRFSEMKGEALDCFASKETIDSLKTMYPYVFSRGHSFASRPKVNMVEINKPVHTAGLKISPVPIYHGDQKILGYRIDNFAYLTDCSGIPGESYRLLNNLSVLVLGALRHTPHPNHLTVDQAVKEAEKIKPDKLYLTHMTHNLDYYELNNYLPDWAEPAYDGLKIHM